MTARATAVRLDPVSPTPHEIQTKEFREAFRGYRQDDVDEFLDEVVEDVSRITQENQRLRVQVAALQQEVARLQEGGGAVVDPSVKAETQGEAREEAKRALAAAQSAAESLLREARAKADEVIADAERHAQDAERSLAARARELDPGAASEIEDLQSRIDDLKRQEAEIRTRLRDMLDEQLQALDRAEAQTRHSATVQRMSREIGDPAETPEPDPKRFWTEPST